MIKVYTGLALLLGLAIGLIYGKLETRRLLPEAEARREKQITDLSSQLMKEANAIENSIIQSLPIYSDFANASKEAALRKYLLAFHLDEGEKNGVGPVRSDEELDALVKEGHLVSIDHGKDSFFYFYNVPAKYRVLTPHAAKGLELFVKRIQENLKKKGGEGNVKIALSSVLRPDAYQKNLRGRNSNASFESSHSHGISFDIFYDDFFTVLSEPVSGPADAFRQELKRKIGFLLGDALSRQYHSILMMTLLELQEEGLLYAILEKRQRVYHVTIRGN